MDSIISLYNILATTMPIPQPYDWFHLVWIGIVIAISIFLVCKFKNASDSDVRKMAGIFWGVMVVFEIIKQFLFGIVVEEDRLVWDYMWYFFPFQFCSSPLYILPIVAFAKDGKFRDNAISFLATFSLFAGICVYVLPSDVFMQFTLINYQTMIHHGTQIFFGVYLAFRYREKLNFKNLLGATAIFSTLAVLALLMNVLTYHLFPALGVNDYMNMFFISPYYDCPLPLLSVVYKAVPYPVFLCVYIFGFMLCAGLIMLIMKGIIKLSEKNNGQITNNK